MRPRSIVLTALCALLVSAASQATPPANGADLNRGYDWTVRLQTEELDRYFDYEKSALEPLDRVYADYYQADDDKSATAYEKMWYHEGKPYGLERLQKLGVTKGETVRLLVTHKSGNATAGETKAAANAILRIWLDAQLNKNALVVVTVPASSLQPIADELVAKHSLVVVPDGGVVAGQEQAINTTMNLLLESEGDGKQIKMAYL